MTRDTKTPKPPAAPAIGASARRFLAQLMEYCFREGWRTPDDFVKHFSAPAIMAALERAPELRVAILSAATGIYEEILRRKSPTLAAEDLALALDEGTTSSLQLLAVFSPEDRVRYLDPREIWDFLAEDQFWRFDPEASEEQRRSAAERMSFTLMQAVQERLITLRDILDGLTYDAVADSLSPNELRNVVRHALVRGRDGIGLNEKVLLEILPLDKLVRSMPLEHIWNEVVIRRLAAPAGLTDVPPEEPQAPTSSRPSFERPPSEPKRSMRASALPPPFPPDRRSSASGGDRVRSAPPSAPPSAATAFYASEPVTGSHEATTTHPAMSVPAEYGQAADVASGSHASGSYASGSYAPGEYPQGAGYAQVSGYTEDDNELTTAAPPVSSRDNSLLPPPLLPPPSSPGARVPLTDDFNRPISSPAPGAEPRLVDQRLGLAAVRQGNGVGDEGESMDRQRQRVTEHLRAIGRLPPRHAAMPASVLRSIDAMYALLPSATDDIQRKSVIRQAFANESYLRVALLGLIELMDSSVDTSDPVIQEAKIEALIKILLFEEQRRKENGRFPMTAFPGSTRAPSSPPPSSIPGGFNGRAPTSTTSTQWPAPALGNGAYPSASAPPLPNLPAEPRRRTQPPPLPPSYPRG